MSRTAPNRIRELRTLAGLSQQDLAERINGLARNQGQRNVAASGDTVGRWERGTVPQPIYRRLLAEALVVSVEDLHLDSPPARPAYDDHLEEFVEEALDSRVKGSQDDWRRTRQALNAQRHALSQVAVHLYPQDLRLGATGLLVHPDWLPAAPIDLAAIDLEHQIDAPHPVLDGTGTSTSHVRPRQSLVRHYGRYTQAIRDLAMPKLFDNRLSWRITGVSWGVDKGQISFADTTYFASMDVFEAAAHELAYVALSENGKPTDRACAMRDLPLRRLIGDPFDTGQRPMLASMSTLVMRAGSDGADFILHRRDSRSVAAAGGMLHVIPTGIFQPSSVLQAARAADFDLWRNFQREFSEELLGNAEHDGDGQPVRYDEEPFVSLDTARRDGRIRIYCLGVALDALTLVGEVLTVAVVDATLFDDLDRDFVERNDEGSVVNKRVPFTEEAIGELLASGRLAPAAAGCVELAWRYREHLMS